MENISESPSSGDEEIWSEVDEAYPDGPHQGRRDGFTPKRRRLFLKTLRKTASVSDACRRVGLSTTAAYNLRERDQMFADLWDAALSQAGADFDLLAWRFGVEGVEEEVWAYGKMVGTRLRRDPHVFRMMLQASNPAKYGGQGFGSRKQLEKKIRKQIEAEQAQAQAHQPSVANIDEVRERVIRRLGRLRERELRNGAYIDEYGVFYRADHPTAIAARGGGRPGKDGEAEDREDAAEPSGQDCAPPVPDYAPPVPDCAPASHCGPPASDAPSPREAGHAAPEEQPLPIYRPPPRPRISIL